MGRNRRGQKKKKNKSGRTSRKYKVEDGPIPLEQMECYVFNDGLDPMLDDGTCEHCKYFLTTRCPHVDEFLEEFEDMEPDL